MISIPFFSPSTPFGPFQPLHQYVITNAVGISWNNWYNLFITPLAPLVIQTYLLRYKGTRFYRIAVGLVGIALMGRAAVSYRFTQPWFNALNNAIGIGAMHIIARYLEFAFIEGPLFDRYFEAKGRHPLIGALDVAMNARWIGLGSIDLDDQGKVDPGHINLSNGNNNKANGDSKPPRMIPSKDDTDVADGGFKFSKSNKTIPDLNSRSLESWLPWPKNKIQRTRFQAFTRHTWIALKNYVIFDTFLYIIRTFGKDTIGAEYPVKNALRRFATENTFYLFPFLSKLGLSAIKIPKPIVEMGISMNVAVGVWLGISMGYHALGALCVGSGIWETESWEIDMFDSPLMADSLLDCWGKRWHQFFRHHFILYSTLFLRLFKLPPRSSYILCTSFFLSGLMHSIGQFSMDPHPPLLPLFLLFPLSGVFGAIEIMFKKFTGRRVRGTWGRIWTWTVMLGIGHLGTRAWLESGVGGNILAPPFAGEWITKNILEPWILTKA